ncbi:hypothetical protein DWX08_01745 [Ruminococcus sp. AF18-22]|nr:hypothetical protein DWX08_01745 [Ruminococcus sp. AF18-22]
MIYDIIFIVFNNFFFQKELTDITELFWSFLPVRKKLYDNRGVFRPFYMGEDTLVCCKKSKKG